MSKAFELGIVRARYDARVDTISDAACLAMVMTGPASALKFSEASCGGYFDFFDSAVFVCGTRLPSFF